jgi:hypothetical protein
MGGMIDQFQGSSRDIDRPQIHTNGHARNPMEANYYSNQEFNRQPNRGSGMIPNLNSTSNELNTENHQRYENHYQNGNSEAQMYNQRRTKFGRG